LFEVAIFSKFATKKVTELLRGCFVLGLKLETFVIFEGEKEFYFWSFNWD
jgi:hypothetical protein